MKSIDWEFASSFSISFHLQMPAPVALGCLPLAKRANIRLGQPDGTSGLPEQRHPFSAPLSLIFDFDG